MKNILIKHVDPPQTADEHTLKQDSVCCIQASLQDLPRQFQTLLGFPIKFLDLIRSTCISLMYHITVEKSHQYKLIRSLDCQLKNSTVEVTLYLQPLHYLPALQGDLD